MRIFPEAAAVFNHFGRAGEFIQRNKFKTGDIGELVTYFPYLILVVGCDYQLHLFLTFMPSPPAPSPILSLFYSLWEGQTLSPRPVAVFSPTLRSEHFF